MKLTTGQVILRITAALAIAALAGFLTLFSGLMLALTDQAQLLALLPLLLGFVVIAALFLRTPRARTALLWCAGGVALAAGLYAAGFYGYRAYQDHLTVPASTALEIDDYLPFDPASKIARLDRPASLRMSEPLPVLDGATALFPVYSAFVSATYPEDIPPLNEGPLRFSNTAGGYYSLALKEVDVMFGAYPSEEQLGEARGLGTEFHFTPIGREGFVFFVNKNNPVEGLTQQQLRGIYAGEITNWREVGGNDEPILAFQRNAGSGSQSALVRFMGSTPLMQPPTQQVADAMAGIIERTSDYKNHANAIGFSFRYYAQDMAAGKGIKLLAVDGAAPTVENIRSGAYPLTSEFYAVTHDPDDPQAQLLIGWILSDEGQQLIEQTGYARVK